MKRFTSIILAVLMVTTVLSGGVVAQSESEDQSYFDQLREPGDQGSAGLLPADASETATAAVSRALTVGNRIAEKYIGDAGDENATAYANDFKQSFNENNETLIAYANERMDANASHAVIEIEFSDTSGATETRYLVTTVENESYTSAKVVESTDQNVTDTITADWYASRHAASELDTFVTDYASTNEDVSRSYWVRMVAKYGGGINGTLWGDA